MIMTDFTTYIKTAQRMVETDDFTGAVKIAERIRQDPKCIVQSDFHLVYYIIAVARFKLAMKETDFNVAVIDKSIALLEKSIQLNPNHADSNMMMGQMFLVRAERPDVEPKENYIKSKKWFEKAAELGDPWPKAFCIPQIELIKGKLEELGD